MCQSIIFSRSPLSVADVVNLSQAKSSAVLDDSADFIEWIEAGARVIDDVLRKDGKIYGVTTGYGDSCEVSVPLESVNQLPVNLTRFHGCGLGKYFSEAETRAILAVRLGSLCQGYSGVSYKLLQRLSLMLQHDILPLIPEEGSVGASGDLTPLSYIAGALIGEREVRFQGKTMLSSEAFSALGIEPYQLRPKEALALMNGTAVMTALACLAYDSARYLCQLSSRITSLTLAAVGGNPYHFDEQLHAVKPHAGQQQVAAWIRSDLVVAETHPTQTRLQDRYSIRCAPHIVGAVQDALPFIERTLLDELNSANDNPIVDSQAQRIHHGGHFYGGHIAMVMDLLKTQVANLADLHDRQMALMLDEKSNNGLPANLSAATGEEKPLSHGFKAVQIGCSAWTAEALKLTMPASVFSRSTECHNQDKVSMGTIAARDCRRVIELTEQVAAAAFMAASHGCLLRKNISELVLTEPLQAFLEQQQTEFPLLTKDRPLEMELRKMLNYIAQQHWQFYKAT
ncbi:HAL/PAL/TAL family ammonia-lyase [Idiomarina seosinensis]|uniref:tyrosine ammonia-lyase n=1 Tax=Idiomarina seosinensis TaxID=281739 RepID=A0A432ZIX6_9GAMM|nr:aromatic amino acid ammonia-lyase [Idiomarina seosinensis]RUO77844.1 histidine ammonia-lyase [Idiomarina seosinensis]